MDHINQERTYYPHLGGVLVLAVEAPSLLLGLALPGLLRPRPLSLCVPRLGGLLEHGEVVAVVVDVWVLRTRLAGCARLFDDLQAAPPNEQAHLIGREDCVVEDGGGAPYMAMLEL